MDEDVKTVHITKALSSAVIVNLIENYPNLEVITCSPSVYDRTSSKYIDALSQLDIEVKKKYNWGAKSQTNGAEFEVLELSDNGLKPKEIAQKLDLKLNRVYYLLKKSNAKYDNRKRKHDHEEIKELKNEGLSAKEISQKLNIPLRSVYYILNKK
ncbi:hypothetical protein SAMN05216439_0500 [Methanobrevibacter gottschalkii]|uniref:Uncharacterized protein n=2 Tax=Methanobrevibacter gottschalkii TaxID=190974 RepID=A0A3N5B908_9EURY|nr:MULTISPECIES: hypothetical protein [Methanobrevibacter]MCQ2970217.1 hypothetical protein [archaeon]OEC94620.1 hypothetical protein A9505_08265 [Methanobrevibacter sp. A27]RPF51970.1 hypothetical protein EDC42_1313 [Methanobrevibacter gottschalkii DSM 11977]SEL41622.1 hypothetical protein SAMN05216439_0500 [Methanobrevibacter gottschalkii]